ncbi:head GIN domain-containing protein [Niveibacterium sp.]|uniref:head GIN domain-containing protein n=1 Tax=Niveibacterium sp. TaxID=2017444 RepID=UPI0035AFCAC0
MLRAMLFTAALSIAAPAVSADSGKLDKPLAAFDRLEVSVPFDVSWQAGPPHVSAEGDADYIERLRVEVRDGKLFVDARPGNFSWFGAERKLKIRISSPELREARLIGSGDMALNAPNGDALAISLSGSGDLVARGVKAKRLDVRLSGSGDVVVDGETDSLQAALSGSGDIKLKALQARETTLTLAGSGDIEARAGDRLAANCTGSGDIDVYGPAPQREVSKVGTCDIHFHP